jgi:hypothetical protein
MTQPNGTAKKSDLAEMTGAMQRLFFIFQICNFDFDLSQ